MNIHDAKIQVKNAVKAYMAKDKFGNYMIPQHKQRPVFLMGPPGIGKTAIMEQIASELRIGLLSYSMTHHTRQSALGLPMIKQLEFEGNTYDISEYTMSEIIASIYQEMKVTGIKNGILFLDEINCVSETLTPIMLQFLQYKVFGKHKVPDGWIVVTAGNPPEYNDSVREFDVATWDRLKRVDVEPEFEAWEKYAIESGVHYAVISYLKSKKNNFYKIETTENGKSFVTARGWDDLSQMIQVYEHEDIEVDRQLISQYIQSEQIAQDFADYYEIYSRYRRDYNIIEILKGNVDDKTKARSAKAKTPEKIAVTHLLLDELIPEIIDAENDSNVITGLHTILRNSIDSFKKTDDMMTVINDVKSRYQSELSSKIMSQNELNTMKQLIAILEEEYRLALGQSNVADIIKSDFNERVEQTDNKMKSVSTYIDNIFIFISTYFKDNTALTTAVREMTGNHYIASFLANNPNEQYTKYCSLLYVDQRKTDLKNKISNLSLD